MLTSESFTEPIIFHHLRFAADSIFIWTFSFLGKYYIFAQINQSFCRHICIPQICYCMVSIQSKLHAILGIIHQSTNLLFKLLLVSVFIDQTILFVLDQKRNRSNRMACHNCAAAVHRFIQNRAPAFIEITGEEVNIGFSI